MALRYVDPSVEYDRWYRVLERFGRSRAGGFMARHLFWHIDPWLYRATRGRYPAILGGISAAPLISTGAKSGQPREHQLAYFHDGSDAIVVASYLGEPRNPAWFYNLKAHPGCRFGDQDFVAVEVTDPDDYERLYALAEHVCVNYADYRIKAAALGRRIPVFRLKPVEAAALG
ncbi:nitroreductase family deazaflavin-dependent oxidoreductase [Mycobacterium ahvazicum]|uniref:Nitroreductase family deazaflavin-dependent oxidoreductase n=1 Tax=Mycobacterium ahvazicum TaxID=1964395 RepID=A0A2K4YFQ5_9MYCO|nr:nitroreductase/quinone reductase family protein [Mycobacterium ahvazicum]SOX55618.1 nitroreductase family deazaflavin-dependent oxidoreductase [Mycobacterium ahvazicum]